jgi:hypothetical protein
MSTTARIFLSIGIIVIDWFIFVLPLTALFLVYIIWVNPRWFREFLDTLSNVDGP